ncbi:MAG TPA: hypothetical protein VIM73_19045 [Polyangiaceae bacterium]
MSRSQVKYAAILFAFAALAAPWDARAIHKNWLMKNSGSECGFNTPNNVYDNYYAYTLYNGASYSRGVSCPIALSGRWGAGASSPIKRWAGAWAANIYVVNNQPGTSFSCSVRASLASGALHYSRSVSTTLGGDRRLTPGYSGDWGGTLEGVETNDVSYMDFNCTVPGNGSGVYGYRVRICQHTSSSYSDCWDTSANNSNGELSVKPTAQGRNWVQTSGIECKTTDNGALQRGHEGIKNTGTDYISASCPIVPPADDTFESNRNVSAIAVYYKTAQSGVFPICQLHWHDRFDNLTYGQSFVSGAFTYQSSPDRVVLNTTNVRLDVGMAVNCDLPPGMTLQGITTDLTVSDVSGGG